MVVVGKKHVHTAGGNDWTKVDTKGPADDMGENHETHH